MGEPLCNCTAPSNPHPWSVEHGCPEEPIPLAFIPLDDPALRELVTELTVVLSEAFCTDPVTRRVLTTRLTALTTRYPSLSSPKEVDPAPAPPTTTEGENDVER